EEREAARRGKGKAEGHGQGKGKSAKGRLGLKERKRSCWTRRREGRGGERSSAAGSQDEGGARQRGRAPAGAAQARRAWVRARESSMQFHHTDAKRMLASASIMAASGNKVYFGPEEEDNFISNVKTGKTMRMKQRNGVYVLDVFFLIGGKQVPGEIVVDSGAAECVMPKDLFPEITPLEKKAGVRFAAANGKEMGNYGRKILQFLPRTEALFSRRA
ncbi:hypothetical protein N9L68_00930, partial [bacterium]|nr:hypothetical protein [bacterium]